MQEIHAEINSYNQTAAATGKPIYRCINMYRWCSWCDGWNIDGADNSYKSLMLSDWDAAFAQNYTWPQGGSGDEMLDETPTGQNLALDAVQVVTDSDYGPAWGGANAIDGVVDASSKWVSAGRRAAALAGARSRRCASARRLHCPARRRGGRVVGVQHRVVRDSNRRVADRAVEHADDRQQSCPRQCDDAALRVAAECPLRPAVHHGRRRPTTSPRIPEFEVWGTPVGPTPPNAAFEADVTDGPARLTVQFTDQSTGGPITSWQWDFGDGGTSNVPSPTHTYAAPGTYTVALGVVAA